MSRINLIFTTSRRDPISLLIRWWTWSRFSHVGIVDGEHVIEASGHADKSGRRPGVRVVPLDEFMRADVVEIASIPHPDPAGVLAFCRSQVGKKYDWSYIFGIFMRRDFAPGDNEKWACPELITAACAATGHPIIRQDRSYRVSQEHLWMLSTHLSSMPELD